ncbi:hypothetical protein ACSFA3_13965 [Variovorax sp. RHLX14]|uniref:hypothetical protein n=1 Tax=Variovorax sp. RHLX14 TaxID=1259731 RepID=UPI003F48B5F9
MPLQPIFETKGPPLIPVDKLADLDTSFLVPCVHCDALFQEGELFCPSCGKDQRVAANAADAPSGTAQGVGWLGPRIAGPVQPDADLASRTPTSADGRSGSGARRPIGAIVGVLAALLLAALGLLLGVNHYSAKRSEADRLQGFDAAVTQLRNALDRGDLAGAGRAFGLFDATQTSDPGVLALRESFDQRMRDEAERREQLSAAATSASRSLGFEQTAATPQTLQKAPEAPEAPASAAPSAEPAPPASSSTSSSSAECKEALAAMSLCQSH